MKLNESKVAAAETEVVLRLVFSGGISENNLITTCKARPAHIAEALRRLFKRGAVELFTRDDELLIRCADMSEERMAQRALYESPL